MFTFKCDLPHRQIADLEASRGPIRAFVRSNLDAGHEQGRYVERLSKPETAC